MQAIVGTAQFGLEYGITNTTGVVTPTEAAAIVNQFAVYGPIMVDTAYLYGNSEQILGTFLPHYSDVKIITKTPKFSGVMENARAFLRSSFTTSLKRLACDHLYGLLLHEMSDLKNPTLWKELITLKAEGFVKKIGVSVYNPEDCTQLLTIPEIEIVQFPLNVLDQRFLQSGILEKLKLRGVELHARSIFLQGTLLANKIPAYFLPIRHTIEAYFSELQHYNMLPMQGAVAFIQQVSTPLDGVVVGFTNRQEAAGFLEVFHNDKQPSINFSRFAINESRFINPSYWPEKQFFWSV